jgi:predicted enzyme related to lactoylglutathione lyase
MTSPHVFRITLQVADLERGSAFYAELLGTLSRPASPERAYLDCGPVILMLHNPSTTGGGARPAPDIVYFATDDLERVHARARALGCLSREDVHGARGGEIAERPWGERSFYAVDPFGNELCFVDAGTLHTGR